MRITDLLDVRSISLNAAPADKSQTLDAAVSLMTRSGKINDEEAYRKQVYAREEESTTGIGEGIAIPVSYTHLDVYKRQSSSCATSAGVFP